LKIIIELPKENEEEIIIIKVRNLSKDIVKLINAINSKSINIIGYQNNKLFKLKSEEIFYIEVVDKKIYIYLEKEVYESKQKLYELENNLNGDNFIRISKSVLLNIDKLKAIMPTFNGRFEAILINEEKLIVSRSYVSEFKKRFGV